VPAKKSSLSAEVRRIANLLGVPHATEAELQLRIFHDITIAAQQVRGVPNLWRLLKIVDAFVENLKA
jgi:hypothetical protein